MERAVYDGEAVAFDASTNTLWYPRAARPHIQAKHIDGPVLYTRDGQLHWLTLWERLLFWLGLTDAEALERKWWDQPWNSL